MPLDRQWKCNCPVFRGSFVNYKTSIVFCIVISTYLWTVIFRRMYNFNMARCSLRNDIMLHCSLGLPLWFSPSRLPFNDIIGFNNPARDVLYNQCSTREKNSYPSILIFLTLPRGGGGFQFIESIDTEWFSSMAINYQLSRIGYEVSIRFVNTKIQNIFVEWFYKNE